jgi:uncharacterized protein YlbG (UPF0298 family)
MWASEKIERYKFIRQVKMAKKKNKTVQYSAAENPNQRRGNDYLRTV